MDRMKWYPGLGRCLNWGWVLEWTQCPSPSWSLPTYLPVPALLFLLLADVLKASLLASSTLLLSAARRRLPSGFLLHLKLSLCSLNLGGSSVEPLMYATYTVLPGFNVLLLISRMFYPGFNVLLLISRMFHWLCTLASPRNTHGRTGPNNNIMICVNSLLCKYKL